MKNFEYAQPRTEAEMLQLLEAERGQVELLAGGTDLVGLMKKMVVTPERVVNVSDVDSMRGIEVDPEGGLSVGAAVHLDQFLESSLTDAYPAVNQAILGINSPQLQAQGTVGGELLRRPTCWYFRDRHGLLADGGRMVAEGDNRYHAILGNRGPAKFVSASRLAPALISLGAHMRVIGPGPDEQSILPLENLYRVPQHEGQRENTLLPNQVLTHILLPADDGRLSAAYEVRHGAGPDMPLAAAAVTLQMAGDLVRAAKIVLGQVAPVPWISHDAAQALVGKPVNQSHAEVAGVEAVAAATPLSCNQYKVQLAQVAVKRAILMAAGLETGGF